jgi:hypothetical protein
MIAAQETSHLAPADSIPKTFRVGFVLFGHVVKKLMKVRVRRVETVRYDIEVNANELPRRKQRGILPNDFRPTPRAAGNQTRRD